jgi:hypothetical protein
MSEPVIIGIKEVYDAVTKLDGNVEQLLREHALLQQRVTYLEQAGNKKWQTQLAVGLALLSLVGSPVMALLIR